jgi:capsular polysaccharide biosynthesis protein
VQFNGVHILEDMSFNEQIKLFNTNNVFIFIHGSCLSNLLFAPYNSIVYELEILSMNNNINVIKRLCKLTNSEHIRLIYDTFLPNNIIL